MYEGKGYSMLKTRIWNRPVLFSFANKVYYNQKRTITKVALLAVKCILVSAAIEKERVSALFRERGTSLFLCMI